MTRLNIQGSLASSATLGWLMERLRRNSHARVAIIQNTLNLCAFCAYRSGHGNHSTVHEAPLVDGRDGHKARHFGGEGYIAVDKSPVIAPISNAWTIEATLRAEKPDGIVLAHGGETIGYCLYLAHGKPAFTVRSQKEVSTVTAASVLPEGWNTITAKITPDSKLILLVNGQPAGKAPLKNFIRKEPNNSLEIGADLGSQVLPGDVMPKFVGLIESVKISSE